MVLSLNGYSKVIVLKLYKKKTICELREIMLQKKTSDTNHPSPPTPGLPFKKAYFFKIILGCVEGNGLMVRVSHGSHF